MHAFTLNINACLTLVLMYAFTLNINVCFVHIWNSHAFHIVNHMYLIVIDVNQSESL